MTEQMEPLSAARLEEIRRRLDRTPAIPFTLDDEAGIARVRMSDVRWAVYVMRDLLAEHDRQAAEIARLRAKLAARDEIVRAVANSVIPYTTPGEDAIGAVAGSVVKQARVLLAADGAVDAVEKSR